MVSSHHHLLSLTIIFMQTGYILNILLLNVPPVSVCAGVFWVSNIAFKDCSKQEKPDKGLQYKFEMVSDAQQ